MKLLVSISNYGYSQLQYLEKIVSEFQNYTTLDVTINVHSTVDIVNEGINLIKYDQSIKNKLVFKHRKEFVENANNYDVFLYTENDIHIKENAILTFLKYDSILPPDTSLGFIRYECRDADTEKYLPDVNPFWPSIKTNNLSINNKSYFELHNVHQGCWVLTKEKLLNIMQYPFFQVESDSLETGASGIFKQWGGIYKKVFTRDANDLNNCFVHHLSNKYCNLNEPVWQHSPGPMTVNTLKSSLSIS